MLAGKWTYRNYRNETALVGDDAAAALALIFGESMFELPRKTAWFTTRSAWSPAMR